MSDEGFLSRWSRRKVEVKQGAVTEDRPRPEPIAQPEIATPAGSPITGDTPTSLAPAGRGIEGEGAAPTEPVEEATPPPTLEDVAHLTPSSDYTPFLTRNVDESVKRAALKKLFTDPHFNVMDGLDTYIDDYSKFEPIPESMLRRMTQSKFLGLFDDEEKMKSSEATDPKASTDGGTSPAVTQSTTNHPVVPTDEDPDLRLQQDDAARCGSADESPAG